MSTLPVFLHSLQPEVEATDGDIVTFQVKVAGNPTPVVSWLHCGDPVYHVGGRREIIDHPDGWHELILTNITLYDDGEYECKAENQYGQCSCFSSLYYYEDEGRADSTTEGTVEGTSTDEQGDTKLLILIDDGSDTECEEDGSCKRSLSASEQIEGIFDGINGNASTGTLSYDFTETTEENQFSEAREDESISPAQCPDQLAPEVEEAIDNVGSFHYVVKTPLEYADLSKGRIKKNAIIINADKASSDSLRGGRRTEVIGDHLNMSYSRSSYRSSGYRRTEGTEDYSSRSSRYEARRSSRDSESYLARSTRTRFAVEGDEELASFRRTSRLTSRDDDDDSSSWKRARLSGAYEAEESSGSLSRSARVAALSFTESVEGPNGRVSTTI